ncbi:hypothetical protein F4604DRAFT_1879554 [Suillus subluteus]|nr:hypothetical protein F4604DRAFT_1879554 [Suillus subluteus]
MGWTDDDLDELHHMAHLQDAQDAMAFITALRKASLDDSFAHPDLLMSLKLFFPDTTIKAYNLIHAAISERHPDDDVYSYYHVKQLSSELSGVVPLVHDMCINTCLAFTGPFADLDRCPRCGEDCWDQKRSTPQKKVAQQKFNTYPIGPQLQALWWHPDHTEKMHWREEHRKKILKELKLTGGVPEVYEDMLHGKQYLDACQSSKIKEGDSVLMLSIDGVQLYESKQSDCWVYIWVLFNHAPEERYQKKYVLPSEGLAIWNGALNILFQSNPFLFVATADGPSMAFLTGLVGHHGKFGCRLYCGLPGRHKPGAPTYYPAMRQPHGNTDHPNILINQLSPARSLDYEHNVQCIVSCQYVAKYEQACLETGITKPSIFCGFDTDHILLIPLSFGSDIMHVAAINAMAFSW